MGASSSKPANMEVEPDDTRENRAIKHLQQLCAQFITGACTQPGCREPLVSDPETHYARWSAGAQEIPPRTQLSVMVCANGHLVCVGCGKEPTIDPNKHHFTTLGVINHCCDAGRISTVYFLLARFDEAHVRWAEQNREKAAKNAKSRKSAKKALGHGKKALVAGVGYGMDSGMNGFGNFEYDTDEEGYEVEYFPHHRPLRRDNKEDEREEEQMEKDILMSDTVKLLIACLPDFSSDASAELNMFRLSTLFDKLTEMIRNDSIVDITERFDVYNSITAFIEKIARHDELVQLLSEERPIIVDHPGIKSLAFTPANSTYSSPKTYCSAPFVGSYGNTFLQAKTFLSMTQKTKAKSDTPATFKNTELLLSNMVACFQMLDRTVKKPDPAPQKDPEVEAIWSRFAEENRLTFTDEVLCNHRNEIEFNTVQSSNRGRLNTISKEIATMKTSLPPGVFLKVAESRSDVMKVLMIGSEGSPYAGGLFTFDIFLDSNYPQRPPRMTFVMKGNDDDGESFNPNLHLGTGTVCLSLLNTWPGHPSEAWQPGRSTILSVLVSVQAMILGAPLPWENEPGHEGSGPTPTVLSHKSRVQSRTIRFAMIAWLENKFETSHEHVWKEISQTYWKHNGTKVLQYVKEWVKETPGLLCYGQTDYWARMRHLKVEAAPSPPTCNLVEKLSTLLGIEYKATEFEAQMRSALAQTKRKGKAPGGSAKKMKLESKNAGSISVAAKKWVYTGQTTQKVVKKACKDFGIGFKGTIAASVERLEAHVNEDLENKDAKLVLEWGEKQANPSAAGHQTASQPYGWINEEGQLLTDEEVTDWAQKQKSSPAVPGVQKITIPAGLKSIALAKAEDIMAFMKHTGQTFVPAPTGWAHLAVAIAVPIHASQQGLVIPIIPGAPILYNANITPTPATTSATGIAPPAVAPPLKIMNSIWSSESATEEDYYSDSDDCGTEELE
ncbi:uncharacterized protein L3040_008001 [Drepanopeziza brunnea f. sp. 'multigermtubi']|uniref:Ubiquitin-conjugating enzyme family protein n=1 Tax=Marssonina brunnea f. sp. multigermtubi (strain MB_m1) TaxID=1072389 RepID=K1W9R4_MARBU|nr:ubiquitin-conjugating enzyme family protein [Drepanopeziza brunnea f. sp. 'multigermtubi' MB_m1]EKD13995.1 ubiquitin-conjugating enzyme family protein [Drepanopeziza brunnea f. sp. 'multigermtubi' MB_m1]KAJ5035535.1 hypothetical protein L3040_008001 [Drepanopeziza brunnea f. sp. 'multigermtubi']